MALGNCEWGGGAQCGEGSVCAPSPPPNPLGPWYFQPKRHREKIMNRGEPTRAGQVPPDTRHGAQGEEDAQEMNE